MANFFYNFASNRPTKYERSINYAKEELEELIAHYEEDFKDCV